VNIWESVRIALDNVKVNKMRSFLTIIGIVVGVAAVIAVISIGQAGKSSIVSDIQRYGEEFFVVFPDYARVQGQEEKAEITLDDVAQIKRTEGVREAVGVVSLPMDSRQGKEEVKFSVVGTSAGFAKIENIKLEAGRFFSEQEERARQKVIVVESNYAVEKHGSAQAAIGRKVDFNGKIYRIVGVTKSEASLLAGLGEQRYGATMPILSLPLGDEGALNKVNYVEIAATTSEQPAMDQTIERVKKLLAKRHTLPQNSYTSQTGMEAQAQISSVFNVLQTVIGSIAGISLFVGGIGVMNIMLVSVTERTREIGIRKAIGATPGMIMQQFLVEAIILCSIGGLMGILVGLLGAGIFSLATDWPFLISWWTILLAFGFSTVVGIFFGLYPANKAARMQPIESLRYE